MASSQLFVFPFTFAGAVLIGAAVAPIGTDNARGGHRPKPLQTIVFSRELTARRRGHSLAPQGRGFDFY